MSGHNGIFNFTISFIHSYRSTFICICFVFFYWGIVIVNVAFGNIRKKRKITHNVLFGQRVYFFNLYRVYCLGHPASRIRLSNGVGQLYSPIWNHKQSVPCVTTFQWNDFNSVGVRKSLVLSGHIFNSIEVAHTNTHSRSVTLLATNIHEKLMATG